MYAPTIPKRLTKKQIEKIINEQDGYVTLHYFVVKTYWDIMENQLYCIYDIGAPALVIGRKYYYDKSNKPLLGIVTYKILEEKDKCQKECENDFSWLNKYCQKCLGYNVC